METVRYGGDTSELEIAASKIVKSGLVFEEDDLAELLTAQLEADAHLR